LIVEKPFRQTCHSPSRRCRHGDRLRNFCSSDEP
jgi:hypothetical protein